MTRVICHVRFRLANQSYGGTLHSVLFYITNEPPVRLEKLGTRLG